MAFQLILRHIQDCSKLPCGESIRTKAQRLQMEGIWDNCFLSFHLRWRPMLIFSSFLQYKGIPASVFLSIEEKWLLESSRGPQNLFNIFRFDVGGGTSNIRGVTFSLMLVQNSEQMIRASSLGKSKRSIFGRECLCLQLQFIRHVPITWVQNVFTEEKNTHNINKPVLAQCGPIVSSFFPMGTVFPA